MQQKFENYWADVLKTHLESTFKHILLKFCGRTPIYDINTRAFIEGQDELKIRFFTTFNKSVSHFITKKICRV
jgi:hypothetical protein